MRLWWIISPLYKDNHKHFHVMRKDPLSRKELLLLLATLLTFIVVLSAAGLFFRNRGNDSAEKAAKEIADLRIVEGVIATGNDRKSEEDEAAAVKLGSSTFFLKPTATEMLAALREADPFDGEALTGDEPPLQVIWPGYFFSLQEDDSGSAVVLLDVDEQGFGTILRCLVNPTDYPEIRNVEPGRKIWVAGQVTGVDLAGDGIVTIDVRYVRFDGDPAAAAVGDAARNEP
jgi:hypothetical protein